MRIMKVIWLITVCFSCLLLIGCPAGLKIKLDNASGGDIKVLYDPGGSLLSEIPAGTSAEFVQRTDCLRVKINSEIVEFQLRTFPDNYVTNKSFSPSVSMRLDTNMKLLVLPVNSDNAVVPIRLKQGCKT